MNDSDKIVLGLAFIIVVYALALWLMHLATADPRGFWAVMDQDDNDEDPVTRGRPSPGDPVE